MRCLRAVILIVAVGCAPVGSAWAKGEGVGLWMEGTVSDISANGGEAKFLLSGRFWLEQHRDGKRSTIEIDGAHGVRVAVTQADPFFAMSKDWGAGSIRGEGKLIALLKAAAQGARIVKFELWGAMLEFGRDGSFAVVSGGVVRATDEDLR